MNVFFLGLQGNESGRADMLTSDDRKEVDLHLQRGSIARGVFHNILELVIFKICHNSLMFGGGGELLKLTCNLH